MVIGQQYSDGGVSGTPSGVSNACPGGTEEGSSSSARRSKCLFTLQRRLQYRAQACDSRQLSEKVSDCLVILSFPQTNCKQVTVDCNTHTHTHLAAHTHTHLAAATMCAVLRSLSTIALGSTRLPSFRPPLPSAAEGAVWTVAWTGALGVHCLSRSSTDIRPLGENEQQHKQIKHQMTNSGGISLFL